MEETNIGLNGDMAAVEIKKESFFGRMRRYIRNMPASYLALSFIIPVVIMYIIYIAMEIHPFGNGSVLVLDLNGQYVYFYEALRNFVYGDASLLYSFARSLGGEFLGIYAYYIASPFSYIVCLFPQTKILEALLFIFLLKTGLCGFTFGFYIHKTGKSKSKIATVIFSCMYALTAYAVVQQHNSMWIDAVIWLPIITYAIEQLVKHGKFRMYVIFLALTLMSNFYIGYMVCFWCAAYFFVYYFSANTNDLNNPLHEKRHFLKSFLRFGFYSVLAVGIAAVILLTAYYSLTFGKTTFSDPSWAFEFKFNIVDLLVKFLPGSYDTVRPEGLPFVYCGMLALILVPVYFISSKFSAREKIMSGVMIAFFVLSFSISVVDLVWHGFQKPNWLNYRYSFMLCFFLLVLACRAFSEIKSVSSKTVFAVCAALAGLVIFVQTLGYEYVDDLQTIWFSMLCIAVYLILICLFKITKFRENMLLIMAFAVSFELFANGLTNVVDLDKDVVYSSYSGYNNFLAAYRPIVKTVKENDPSFYRMEKTVHRKTNDNMALNLRGISNSTSTLNVDTINYLRRMGYCSKSHWSKYAGGTAVNDSLIGLKYIISADDLSAYFEPAYTVGEYTAWLNPYALSIAYGVDNDLSSIVADSYETPMDYLNALITQMLGEEETVEVFVPVPLESTTVNSYCENSFIAGHYKYAKSAENYEALVYYTFTAPNEDELFFYFPSDYPREVNLKVNGSSSGSFNGGDTARIVSVGSFEAGETINLTMSLVNNDLYIKKGYNCLYYIDRTVFEDAMARLAEVQYEITDYTERSFKGTITTQRDAQTILTTIPYDEGWRVYVDGKRVEIFESLEALVAFGIDADAGTHDVRISYMSDAFIIGLSVTLLSTLLFVLLFFIEKKLIIQPDNTSGDTPGDSSSEDIVSDDVLPESTGQDAENEPVAAPPDEAGSVNSDAHETEHADTENADEQAETENVNEQVETESVIEHSDTQSDAAENARDDGETERESPKGQ